MRQLRLKSAFDQIDFTYSLIVFIVLILWSSSYIGIRYALDNYTPENLGFFRYLVASIIFLIVSFFKKITLPAIADFPGFIALGVFGFAFYNILLNYGETKVDAGSSSFIINTVPFFTLLFAVLTNTEIAKNKDWIGMLVAFFGVALIIISKNQSVHAFNFQIILILGAAICQALYFIIQKKYSLKYTVFELTAYSIWIGTVIMLLFTSKPFSNFGTAPLNKTLAILYLGAFPGALAFFLIGKALKKYPLSKISSYLFLIPFITIFISWLLIHEVISLYALIGGLFIILGILIKNRKVKH